MSVRLKTTLFDLTKFVRRQNSSNHIRGTIDVRVNGILPLPHSDNAPPHCPKVSSAYRTADGSCNNARHPEWGMAHRPYARLLDADYGDGQSMPSRSSSGAELPAARNVSVVMHPTTSKPDSQYTLSNMQFGQFLSHDISMLTGTTSSRRSINTRMFNEN